MRDAGLTQQDKANCPQLAVRPGWHGPCHEGHRRCVRAVKRREARQREKKRAARLAP
jgi:hypothetical protein